MLLSSNDFSSITEKTPLIFIDLIIKNSGRKILLGKRVNKSAKEFSFIPGGKVFKDEIGLHLKKEESTFQGAYEYFYKNNVFNSSFNTHYIILAHQIITKSKFKLNNQHE